MPVILSILLILSFSHDILVQDFLAITGCEIVIDDFALNHLKEKPGTPGPGREIKPLSGLPATEPLQISIIKSSITPNSTHISPGSGWWTK